MTDQKVCAMAPETEEAPEEVKPETVILGELSMTDIIEIDDIEMSSIEVPEWNGIVFVRVLSGANRDRLLRKLKKATDEGRYFTPELVALCLCDKCGDVMFATDGAVKALSKKSSVVLERIADVAIEINGLNDEAVDKAEKN